MPLSAIIFLLLVLVASYANAAKSFRTPLSVLERSTNVNFAQHDVYGIRLNNYGDIEYYGIVTVGSNAREFRVLFDTGSTEFWITGHTCRVEKKKGRKCKHHALYKPRASSTYKRRSGRFKIKYEIGFAAGFYVSDTVALGKKNDSGLKATDVIFGVADLIDRSSNDDVIDGVMGLGYPVPGEPKSFINKAVEEGLLDEPIYTIYLTKVGGEEHKSGGEIVFGAVDELHCSKNVHFAPLTATKYWQFAAETIVVGNTTLKRDVQIVVDSGSSSLIMPKVDYKQFLKSVGLSERLPGLPYVSCKLKFVLDFFINGTKFSLTAQELMVRYADGCVLEVDVTLWADDTSWVLGHPFGRTYCTTYDLKQKRVGFSRAITDVKRNRVTACGISCTSIKRQNQLLKVKDSNVTHDWPDDLLPWPVYELNDIDQDMRTQPASWD